MRFMVHPGLKGSATAPLWEYLCSFHFGRKRRSRSGASTGSSTRSAADVTAHCVTRTLAAPSEAFVFLKDMLIVVCG
jgi:hypothetical protein